MDATFYRRRRHFGALALVEKVLRLSLACLRQWWRSRQAGRFDLVIIHREASPFGRLWLEQRIRRANPRIVFDFDDAIWAPPSNAVNQRALFWREGRVAELIGMCRHVVAGNAYLATYAREHNPQCSVIPTTFDDPGVPAARPQRERPVVVWIGNLGNAFYLKAVLPACERVARTQPFVLRLIGGEDIHTIRSDALEIDYVAWSAEVEQHALADADIGIMPLVDGPYEQGKCAFKLIQYFAHGLPVIASPVGMNASLVRQGENGMLAGSEPEWENALTSLLAAPARRTALGAAGRDTYVRGFTRSHGAEAWLNVFRSVEEATC